MNRAKFDRALAAQTGLALRVLDAVPMREAWDRNRIVSEHSRLTGTAPNPRAIYACLGDLADAGVIKRRANEHYIRVPVREKEQSEQLPLPETTQPEAAMSQTPSKSCAAPKDSFGHLAAIAASLRKLADEVEVAALNAEAALQQAGSESQKLAELRNLLKSI